MSNSLKAEGRGACGLFTDLYELTMLTWRIGVKVVEIQPVRGGIDLQPAAPFSCG